MLTLGLHNTFVGTFLCAVALVFSLGAGVARGEEIPITFIKVAEVNRLLAGGTRGVLVDVRSHQEYLSQHIKGAVSVPLNTIQERYRELPREGLVVLY